MQILEEVWVSVNSFFKESCVKKRLGLGKIKMVRTEKTTMLNIPNMRELP